MNRDYDWSLPKNDIRNINKEVGKITIQELPSEEDEKRFNENCEKAKTCFQQFRDEKNKPWWKFW